MVFLLTVLGIIIIIIAYKPKKKDANYYVRHPELNRTVTYHSRDISKFNSILNLGWDKSYGLEIFTYKNRQVYLRTQKGKTISGFLENMTTTFVKYPRKLGGYFTCEVKCDGRKLEFYNIDGLFPSEEYFDMWEILSHSGKVAGQGDLNSYKASCRLACSLKNTLKNAVGIETKTQPNLKEALQDTAKAYVGVAPTGDKVDDNIQNFNDSLKKSDINTRLRDAKELFDMGIISMDEFKKIKNNILNF